ncbi:MAG: flagellar biosynthetic protein FliO [Nitrospira sp.]|nr:flagellar biosynthetic protein FliO [Nitrospira sp.]MCP9443579.1 flagellar biosynthetic protein FliO [Nitrospira sp.]
MIDFWDSLLRTLSALAVVLLLMAAAALAARRIVGGRLGTSGRHELIRVVASGAIAPRKTIMLVSVAGEYLIVGATATDLVPLGRVSDAENVRKLLASAESPSAPVISSSPLTAWMQRLPVESFLRRTENHGER